MSRFVLPAGLVPTTVPLSGVKAPVAAIAKPEMVEEAAFDVYANFPSGVIAFQQLASPRAGTSVLMGDSFPSAPTAYEETVEAFDAPAGPVSETTAAPFGANRSEKTPGSTLGFTTIEPRVPFACTGKTSILFVARSVTKRKWPSGLKAIDEPSELFVVRKRVELEIW